MSIIYTAHATSVGGRDGSTKTDDGKIDVQLSLPGSNGKGSNPEQLFAAGYAGCFGQALKVMAEKEGMKPSSITVHVDVNLHKGDDGFSLSAKINADIQGLSQDEAEKLVKIGHDICPYSKATRGNIKVEIAANGKDIH